MIIKRKTQIFLVIFVTSVFLFQSCLTLVRGPSQGIPVTGSPIGAQIHVDGEVVGTVPMILRLKRKGDHVIRIEREGYNPFEIRTTAKVPGSMLPLAVFGNAALSFGPAVLVGLVTQWFVGAKGYLSEEAALATIVGYVAGYIWFTVKDVRSGAGITQNPEDLNVTLTKVDGTPQPNLILINAEKFQNVKWIRIKCDDSDAEDEIVHLDYSD